LEGFGSECWGWVELMFQAAFGDVLMEFVHISLIGHNAFDTKSLSTSSKNDHNLPLKLLRLGGSIVLKVLGHHKLQDHCILASPSASAALTFQLLTTKFFNIYQGKVSLGK
jgi:hypothetical protein